MKVNIKLSFFKSTGRDYSPRLIKWWTNSKYYHTEIFVNDTCVTSSDEYGVTTTKEHVYTDEHDDIDLEVDLTTTQHAALMGWIYSKRGKRYDYKGILLSQILPARIDNPHRWFCSEICTKILQLALVPKVYDLTPNMVSPGRLAKVFGVE